MKSILFYLFIGLAIVSLTLEMSFINKTVEVMDRDLNSINCQVNRLSEFYETSGQDPLPCNEKTEE